MGIVIQRGDPRRTEKEAIVSLVSRWKSVHPEEWEVFMAGQKETRDNALDNGRDGAGSMVHRIRVPRKIMEAIDLLFESEGIRLENDKSLWNWFLESFPEFVIAKPSPKFRH